MSAAARRPRKRPYMDRAVNRRPIQKRFLIICQGEQTEPNYFAAFRNPRLVIRTVSAPRNPSRVVETALRLREQSEQPFDQVWCVFDCDDTPAADFNRALQLAGSNRIEVAYSNQAFELWYLLHFQAVSGALHRAQYIQRLEKHLGHGYQKNSPRLYNELLGLQSQAIERARQLLESYNPSDPFHDDPSTTVHRLVEQLNRSRIINPVSER